MHWFVGLAECVYGNRSFYSVYSNGEDRACGICNIALWDIKRFATKVGACDKLRESGLVSKNFCDNKTDA